MIVKLKLQFWARRISKIHKFLTQKVEERCEIVFLWKRFISFIAILLCRRKILATLCKTKDALLVNVLYFKLDAMGLCLCIASIVWKKPRHSKDLSWSDAISINLLGNICFPIHLSLETGVNVKYHITCNINMFQIIIQIIFIR